MNTNKYIAITLSKGQYLSEVEPFKTTGLPSDSILHKTVTGCGITHCEISHTKRNSIIILPNLPVIKGKVNEHNASKPATAKVLGVHKDIEVHHIQRYVESSVTYKKILTTPEGFQKIVTAFNDMREVLLKNYFLMFDECDRIVSDVDYREKIAAPLNWFFKFEQKALVSATVLPFSDERFSSFQHYIIVPDYDFKKPLKIIDTNNVLLSLRKLLPQCASRQTSIFLNSTKAIIAVIHKLGIANESVVHCAPESVRRFRLRGMNIATSDLDPKRFKKYNFFTSRFFSAVDIVVDYQPDVILVTDVVFAEHTMLDPDTESIQIAGRYRKGISSLTHISNFNSALKARTPEQAKSYLSGCFEVYKTLLDLQAGAASEGAKDTLKTAIESLFVHRYFSDGELNTFLVDNYVHDQLVRGYYQRFANLYAKYDASKHFDASHETELYAIGDNDNLRRKLSQSQTEVNKLLAEQIHRLTARLDNYVLAPEGELEYLRRENPIVTEGYDVLSNEGLSKTDFSNASIKKAVAKAKYEVIFNAVKLDVHEACGRFEKGEGLVSESEIVSTLVPIYKRHGLKKRVSAASITGYYEASRTYRKGTRKHYYVLKSRL